MISNAARAAINLLVECGIDDPAAIEIDDLITYKNGIVQQMELSSCDGRMVMKNGRAIVTVDASIEFPYKKRFVLAHELGHMILHPDREAAFSDDYATLEAYKHGSQETEANEFAAELLMPAALFEKACSGKKFSSGVLKSLSDKFKTSLTSVIYRFVSLGNHPICVCFSKDGKVLFTRRSKGFWPRLLDVQKLNVPSDSVANEYYTKRKIYREDQSDQTIFKSTWFELGDRDRDSKMFEFCLVTKRYNTVLSVIWEK